MTFHCDSGVSPDLAPRRVGGKLRDRGGPSHNNSRTSETDSRDPETETGSLETEKSVHRNHDTLEK